jgi:hypothetical protein
MKQIEFVGLFEKTIAVIDGKEVPDIGVYNDYNLGVVTFVLDINSHAIDIPMDLAEGFILFVADAMAQGAGYPCFGTEKRFNKYNRNITALSGIDINDLTERDRKSEK